MKIIAASIALLSASTAVEARIGKKAVAPFIKLVEDDDQCETEANAAMAKCTADQGCLSCLENAPEKDFEYDEEKQCQNMPACFKGTCQSCATETAAVFACHGTSMCGADETDFAAAFNSKDDECETEANAAMAKCTADQGCLSCLENAQEKDYKFDEENQCQNMPACFKAACQSCTTEADAVFACHGTKICGAYETAGRPLDFESALSNFLEDTDEEECEDEIKAAEEKCSDECKSCFEDNSSEMSYDEANKCINLPSCAEAACSGCATEADALFACGGISICGTNEPLGHQSDLQAALNNFLEDKDDTKCHDAAMTAYHSCSALSSAVGCGNCIQQLGDDDFKCNDDKTCIKMPECVAGACGGCSDDVKAFFNCAVEDDEEAKECGSVFCASETVAVAAVY